MADALKMLEASAAAEAIRASIADPTQAGERTTAHLLLGRPRRCMWVEMWSKLPGLMRNCGAGTYTHTLLPGWQYTQAEMRTEMLDDLEHFAKTDEQPKEATR